MDALLDEYECCATISVIYSEPVTLVFEMVPKYSLQDVVTVISGNIEAWIGLSLAHTYLFAERLLHDLAEAGLVGASSKLSERRSLWRSILAIADCVAFAWLGKLISACACRCRRILSPSTNKAQQNCGNHTNTNTSSSNNQNSNYKFNFVRSINATNNNHLQHTQLAAVSRKPRMSRAKMSRLANNIDVRRRN